MERAMVSRGFSLETLQSRERRRSVGEPMPNAEACGHHAGTGTPGVATRSVFTEMILELPDGRELGGADAAMEIARHIWWLWPLWLVSRIPGLMIPMRAGYRFIASRRDCLNKSHQIPKGDKL